MIWPLQVITGVRDTAMKGWRDNRCAMQTPYSFIHSIGLSVPPLKSAVGGRGIGAIIAWETI